MSRYVYLKLTRAEATALRLAVGYHLELPADGDGVSGKTRAALERAGAKIREGMRPRAGWGKSAG